MGVSMRFLIVIPLFVNDPRHIEMLKVQSLLGARLRKVWGKDADFKIAVVCDYVDDQYWSQVETIGKSFDFLVSPADVLAHAGSNSSWGIRRPTSYALEVVARTLPDYQSVNVLRIIQDTFVMNVGEFVSDLRRVALKDGRYIAAQIHRWPTTGHHWLCHRMGLPCTPIAEYAQGAVMMAPLSVWESYYLELPPEIHHYWDDVMMSLWFTHEGGQLIEIDQTFEHMHHCEPTLARAVYHAHAAELDVPQLMS
ncbi:hypothetical protein SAMN05216404_11071 [Nitrosospira multiformis]|uniref:Uncharacterized protein n=2 Tax=Nitrosospira multiformis TaxID=1231 RepID=A0A1H8LEV8_9PROT|nr:hypothetical protein SAMN05216404_11071 [Nitrosospira multiformis]